MKYFEPIKLYQELLKVKTTGPLLGLHFGRKFLGLAISDDSKRAARELGVVVKTKTNIDFVASELQNFISKYSVSGLLIGYPFNKRRKSTLRQRLIGGFVDDLAETGKFEDMKFTFLDESWTTKMTHERKSRRMFPKPPKFPGECTDEYAAFEILQEYLLVVKPNLDPSFPDPDLLGEVSYVDDPDLLGEGSDVDEWQERFNLYRFQFPIFPGEER